MKKLVATTLTALACLLAVPGSSQAQLLPQYQTSQLDGIAAVVGQDVILDSDLQQAIATVQNEFADDPAKLPPQAVLKKQVLHRLVLQKLQVERAIEMGIRVSNQDVHEATQRIARQNGFSSRELQQALQSRGLSVDQFQQQLADQILVQKLRQQTLRQKVHVSDSEIDNLLNNPIFQAGEVQLAHITLDIPQGASAADIANARKKAETVERKLASGMDFNAAAIRYSDARDALDGGGLGWRSLSELPKYIAEVVAKLDDGEVTPPLRDPAGFHIIKRIAHRAAKPVIVTQYHARHLSIRPDALTSNAQAKQKIIDLRNKIVDGDEDFATVAKAESDDDTTANQGGDMGWFPIDGWGKAVAERIPNMQDGQISEPFEAGGAWHILKRLGVRHENQTDQARRERAQQSIEQRKSKDVYQNFLRKLQAESYVDIRVPGLGDDDDQDS